MIREEKKQPREVRTKASVELVLNLQKLFAYLICSNRRYIEPTSVLKALVDDYGNPIAIGEQKDVGEFNMVFLARINEALEREEEQKRSSQIIRMATMSAMESPRKMSPSEKMRGILPGGPQNLDNGFISTSFFGMFQIITRAKESNGDPIELNTDTAFGQIMINPMEKDIYQGWDTNYFNEISDYHTATVLASVITLLYRDLSQKLKRNIGLQSCHQSYSYKFKELFMTKK